MPTIPINLSNCDVEPIHIPGKIQPHGFLIVTDSDIIIRYLSDNIAQFIKSDYALLIDKPFLAFETLPGVSAEPFVLSSLLKHTDSAVGVADFENLNPLKINIGASKFDVIFSRVEGLNFLEFEPVADIRLPNFFKMISRSLPGILGGKNLPDLLHYTAVEIQKIINYDRVMIYRFAADGHGEVVAEAKNDTLLPWLGLHYPASDIPRQARELYKLNMTRLIADVSVTASGIVASANNSASLDLTYSQLRAVSPIHIQYLKNMGVASSFSISLLYKKELWGLIACHNYTPRFIHYEARESSRLVGQLLSVALEFRQEDEDAQLRESFQTTIGTLSGFLRSEDSIVKALTGRDTNLLQVVHATGALLAYENKMTTLGRTPAKEELAELLKWIDEKEHESVFSTSTLAADFPAAQAYKSMAAGILVITLSREMKEYVVWFKEEILQTVRWAGNPEKPVSQSPDGLLTISPRQSFATWTETVAGTSRPWRHEEITAADRLREQILRAVNDKASAIRLLNEQLRRAYEELDTFSYTVSHDLKNPLTAIKGYSQMLAADSSISEDAKKILLRITDRTDKMNFMIKAVLDYSRVDRLPLQLHNINTADLIREIIQDLKQVYSNLPLQITAGQMPSLQGDPVMIWQVFSNLIGNAVKYSQNALPPRIHIEGRTAEHHTFFTVTDNGIGIAQKDLDNVFLLFSRMDNVQNIEGTGIGLAIVKKIVEKHRGSIWAASELGSGTTFFLSFNLP